MKQHSNKYLKLILPVLTACFIGILFFFFRFQSAGQRADYKRISSEEYDTVFLSMYPIDTYEEESFSYFRAMNILKTSSPIRSSSALSNYMKRIAKSGNTVYTIYLGIRPDLITPGELQNILSLYPSVTFEVILAYPDAAYWAGLSQKEYQKLLESYSAFLNQVPSMEHGNFYFWASTEWLVENPGNYEDHWLVNPDIARTIMLNSDMDHGYNITAANAAGLYQKLSSNTASYRSAPEAYPDLSDHVVVCFGDSVIGNYTDSASIPGVIAGLTGATVYNCGYGGGKATWEPDREISLLGIIDAFLTGTPGALEQDKPAYSQVKAYAADPPSGKKHVFIINYGINDYYSDCPVDSDDPYDLNTYAGSVRRGVTTLLDAFPDAQIILCTPNFTGRFEGGMEPHGPAGNIYPDYANAIIKIAAEFHVDVLDNYNGLPINLDNIELYLEDLVHPNAGTRFTIGSRLSKLIRP